MGMKVAYLTAGAGGMYCGSCMRDNTLAAALQRTGRDVVLIPVYSPIRTDEADVSRPCVFYGGINIFLQQRSGLFRHTPRLFDRLLDYPPLLRQAMKSAGATPPSDVTPLIISILQGETGAQRKELARLIDGLAELQVQLVHLPNALFVGLARRITEALGVPVVCALTGEDIFIDKLPESPQSEVVELIHQGSRHVKAFLSVSRYYADRAGERFGIAREKIHHVPMGIRAEEPTDQATDDSQSRASADESFTIGYLARICPDKGTHLLCDAFEELHRRGRACRLMIAGYVGSGDRGYYDRLQARMRKAGLSEFVEFLGEVDRAEKFHMLRQMDVFSVPTVYREAKGLYILEALSQGVPVVQPGHGSFPELIEATGGGILFEPHSATALADALERLMDDPAKRSSLGNAGRAAVRAAFTDDIMAENVWEVFERVATRGE